MSGTVEQKVTVTEDTRCMNQIMSGSNGKF